MQTGGQRELPQILRRAREALSLSQEEAAAKARLPLRYVKALEGEQVALVPDESYLIPYLRQYAMLLQIEPGEVIPLLLSETRQPHVRRPPELASQARPRRRLWLVAVALGAMAAGGFLLARWPSDSIVRSSFVAHPSPAVAATPAVQPTPRAEAHTALPSRAAASLQELKVVVHERTWIAISADGQPEQTVILQAGEERSWQAADHFLLTVGNAGGITVFVNGIEQPPLGARGEVVPGLRLAGEGRAQQ